MTCGHCSEAYEVQTILRSAGFHYDWNINWCSGWQNKAPTFVVQNYNKFIKKKSLRIEKYSYDESGAQPENINVKEMNLFLKVSSRVLYTLEETKGNSTKKRRAWRLMFFKKNIETFFKYYLFVTLLGSWKFCCCGRCYYAYFLLLRIS